MKIANIKEIVKPVWAHKPGFGMSKKNGKRVYLKQNVFEQGTTPLDPKLLTKLGMKKGDKVLAIAGFYGSWANGLKKAGAKVDYSDVSQSIVNWVEKNVKPKFGKYICSGYESIPKKPLEYDWTFTYEACGGGRGLPIAYLRSLLNKKGGMLMLHLNEEHIQNNKAKLKRYPGIVKNLAKIYGSGFKVDTKKIKARKKNKTIGVHEFLLAKILTNNSAREKAELDLKVLDYTSGKKIIGLEKAAKDLKRDRKDVRQSLSRLEKLSKSHAEDLVKELRIK